MGKKILKIFGDTYEDIWEFYRANVDKSLDEYQKIVALYESFYEKLIFTTQSPSQQRIKRVTFALTPVGFRKP